MASPTIKISSLPPMPPEILQEFCKNLEQPDLKVCRLVCKSFSYAAEIFLFRQVLLKRNVESFIRLRLIAGHHRFSKLVKAICYSGQMLSRGEMDFKTWSCALTDRAAGPRTAKMLHEYSKSLTSTQLQVHYQKYCAYHHSEVLMAKYDIETQDLTSAFAKLPQLEELIFAKGELQDVVSFDQLSSIARETLIVPGSLQEFDHYAAQFTALTKAACITQKKLTTIKAFGIPWPFFQQSKEMLAMVTSAAKACQYLAIELISYGYRDRLDGDDFMKRKANIAKLVSSSPFLHTLEISFDYSTSTGVVRLPEIIEAEVHWPNLKRLTLQAMRAAQIDLIKLLTIHATTLRSLDLAYIHLESHHRDGKEYYGSWAETLVFLQNSLNLDTVRLGGRLTNSSGEQWRLPGSNLSGIIDCTRVIHPLGSSSLKQRIEDFVVQGGVCPLPTPHEAEKAGGWAYLNQHTDWSSDFHRGYLSGNNATPESSPLL